MSIGEWIKTSDILPPENLIVETKIEDENGCGNEEMLYRYKNLWLLPDGRMYVYYTPTNWKFCFQVAIDIGKRQFDNILNKDLEEVCIESSPRLDVEIEEGFLKLYKRYDEKFTSRKNDGKYKINVLMNRGSDSLIASCLIYMKKEENDKEYYVLKILDFARVLNNDKDHGWKE